MRPTQVTVDLDAIVHNARRIQAATEGGALCAVIKADAYGHGAVPVARALRGAGVPFLAVALVEEARALRQAGILGPILLLGADYRLAFDAIVALQLTPAVGQQSEVLGLSAAARRAGKRLDVHLEVDSGMGRFGAAPAEVAPLAAAIAEAEGVRLTGLMTHFSHADAPDGEVSRLQSETLEQALAVVRPLAPALAHVHAVSSGALSTAPFAPRALVRCGLALYGIEGVPERPLGELRPALRWQTQPTLLRALPAGAPVSYGARWRAPQDSRIAVLPVGYADGYPRIAAGQAQVLIRGRRAPIVGTICMDACMVDVTELERDGSPVTVEDEVVLLGRQGEAAIGAGELGRWAQTIAYEIVAGIGPRVPRNHRGAHAA